MPRFFRHAFASKRSCLTFMLPAQTNYVCQDMSTHRFQSDLLPSTIWPPLFLNRILQSTQQILQEQHVLSAENHMNSSLQEKEIVGLLVLLSMPWRTTTICERVFTVLSESCTLTVLVPAMARALRHGTLLALFKRVMASLRH